MRKLYQRILVYRCGTLGDSIVALPTINVLRRCFPNSRICIMTQSNDDSKMWADKVLGNQAGVDGCLTYRNKDIKTIRGIMKTIRDIRSYKPDLVVYLSNDKNSGIRLLRDKLFFAFAANCKFISPVSEKVTFCGRLRKGDRVYAKESFRLVSVLSKIGISDNSIRFDLSITEENRRTVDRFLRDVMINDNSSLIAVCPSSKMPSKRWPIERYGELGLKLITKLGVKIIIVGGSDEVEACKLIKQYWPRDGFAVAAGKLDIMESAELLRRCLVYVGNDTGAMHLSAAVGIPCIAIFSSRDMPGSWYPWGENHACLRHKINCEGCFLESCESMACINNVTVGEVYEVCRRKIEEIRVSLNDKNFVNFIG